MSITDKTAALVTAIRSFGTAVDTKTDDLGADKQPLIANGLATDFYAGTQTWVDFATTARATPMTGVSLADDAAIVAEDSLLTAVGKAQAQLNKLLASGITPGTYRAVTVDVSGRVIDGTNPTTLAGYGIVDAAPLNSPALNGIPTTPTAAPGTNTNQISSTAYVVTALAAKADVMHTHSIGAITGLQTALDSKAPLNSAVLTGIPTAPTAAPGTADKQIANTEFVAALFAAGAATGAAAITGGNIDGAIIGETTASAGTFTSLAASTFNLGGATPIDGSGSVLNIDYAGAGSQYGITMQATTAGATTAINFFNSAGTNIGSITQTDTGVSFNGTATAAPWSGVTGKPTTLAGYGITDAIAASTRGVANGVAALDASGLVPSSQLPSYVDDVLEYANLAGFPATGTTSKIYVAIDTNKIYRWSGSAYIEISPVAGNADTATKLATARTISATGDASWSAGFDGSANAAGVLTLANSGVTAGTYLDADTHIQSITVDSKGRVTGFGPALLLRVSWNQVFGRPNTLTGYGISDAVSKSGDTMTGLLNLPADGLNVGWDQLVVSDGNVSASGSMTAASLNATGSARIGGTGTVANATLYVSGTAVQNVTGVVAENIAWNAGNYFTKTISGATAFTFSDFPASGFAMLTLKLTNGGSAAVTWPASVKWSGGTVPELTAAGVDIINLFTDDGGVTVYGILAGKGMA